MMYGIMSDMKKRRKTEKVTLASIAKSLERLPTKADLEKSVEGLAIMTVNGFENTVSKTDFTEFRDEMTDFKKKTGMMLFNIDSKLQTVDQRLDAIEKTLGPLVRHRLFTRARSASMNDGFRSLSARLDSPNNHELEILAILGKGRSCSRRTIFCYGYLLHTI